jgi:hypothetical protein
MRSFTVRDKAATYEKTGAMKVNGIGVTSGTPPVTSTATKIMSAIRAAISALLGTEFQKSPISPYYEDCEHAEIEEYVRVERLKTTRLRPIIQGT